MALNIGSYSDRVVTTVVAVIIVCSVGLPILADATVPEDMANHDAIVSLLGVVGIALALGIVISCFKNIDRN